MDHIIEKNKRERKGRVYFSKETEAAIVKYNSLDSVENADERSDIYQDHIHYPFFKLTQNIIHTFKFYYTEVENLEHLQHELITFLLSKIHLFNPENGAKAYSYFGTIVKRWLIVYNTKNYGKKIQNIQINDLANYSNLDSTDPGFISSQKMDESVDKVIEGAFEGDELSNQGYKYEDKLSIFIDKYVIECTERIYEIFPKGNDAKITQKGAKMKQHGTKRKQRLAKLSTCRIQKRPKCIKTSIFGKGRGNDRKMVVRSLLFGSHFGTKNLYKSFINRC